MTYGGLSFDIKRHFLFPHGDKGRPRPRDHKDTTFCYGLRGKQRGSQLANETADGSLFRRYLLAVFYSVLHYREITVR